MIVLYTSFFSAAGPERTVSVGVADAIIEVRYRFSDMGAEMVDFRFDEETRSILMTIEVPRDAALDLRFHVGLADAVRGATSPEGSSPGQDLIVTVDGEPKEVDWVRSGLEASTSIPLEAGTKNISIVRASTGLGNQ